MKIQRIALLWVLLSILISYSLAFDPQKSSEDILWKQLKQKIAVTKELKSRFTKEKIISTQKMPQNFIPQSLTHLRTIFGVNKKEEELISLALNYADKMPYSEKIYIKYEARLRPVKEQFRSLAKAIIDNEKKYWDCDVFYHGQKDALALIHDVMQILYSWFNIENANEQIWFLRLFMQDIQEYKNIDDFLEPLKNEMSETISFDHIDEVKKNLLSTNFSLFANLGDNKESTWHYFSMGGSVNPPDLKDQLRIFFKLFDFNEDFVDRIIAIHQKFIKDTRQIIQLSEKEALIIKKQTLEINPGILCQIFVHPDVVDEISYIAEPYGRTFEFDGAEALALTYRAAIFNNQSPLNKIWKKAFEKQFIQLGKKVFEPKIARSSVRKYLDTFRTEPQTIDPFVMDYVQGRLYLKYSVITDPAKIKIITYKTPSLNPEQDQAAEKEYKQKLYQTVEETIKDWLFKEKKREGQKTRLENLFELLKMGQQHLISQK